MSTQSKKSPSYMGWLVRLKRWGLWSILGVIVLYILAFMIDVGNIPDYRGGEAYISYSPDHQYKISRIYPPEELGDSWRSFYLLSAWPSNKPLAIYLVPRDWTHGFKDFWVHKNYNKKSYYDKDDFYHSSESSCSTKKLCNLYSATLPSDDFPDIRLPPDRWNRLIAWVFFKLHPWQDVQLKEQPM